MIGVVDAAHDSINAKAIQKYSNTGFLFPSEAYQTITATFLSNEGLVPILRKMTAGDQTKFLDKVDQVRPSPLLSQSFIYSSHKGLPYSPFIQRGAC